MTEAKRDNTLGIQELEGSYENLTNTSKDLEMQLGESKSECKNLEMGGEGNSGYSDQLIDQLRKEFGTSKDELKLEKQSSYFRKHMINKLSSDIRKLEMEKANNNTADLERLLAVSESARLELEQKLISRDARIRELKLNLAIPQNTSQVAQTTSIPLIPPNPSKTKDDKKHAKLSKDQTRQKRTESSLATPDATSYALTPQMVHLATEPEKFGFKVALSSGTVVDAVKLKSLPNPL